MGGAGEMIGGAGDMYCTVVFEEFLKNSPAVYIHTPKDTYVAWLFAWQLTPSKLSHPSL